MICRFFNELSSSAKDNFEAVFFTKFFSIFEMKNNEITENFNVNFCQDISIEDGRIFKANKCNNNS